MDKLHDVTAGVHDGLARATGWLARGSGGQHRDTMAVAAVLAAALFAALLAGFKLLPDPLAWMRPLSAALFLAVLAASIQQQRARVAQQAELLLSEADDQTPLSLRSPVHRTLSLACCYAATLLRTLAWCAVVYLGAYAAFQLACAQCRHPIRWEFKRENWRWFLLGVPGLLAAAEHAGFWVMGGVVPATGEVVRWAPHLRDCLAPDLLLREVGLTASAAGAHGAILAAGLAACAAYGLLLWRPAPPVPVGKCNLPPPGAHEYLERQCFLKGYDFVVTLVVALCALRLAWAVVGAWRAGRA